VKYGRLAFLIVTITCLQLEARGQYGGGYLSITQSPSIAPLGGNVVIGGTTFPWQPRSGSLIILSGGFTANGVPNINGITVKVNGKQTTIVQDPNFPNRGTWKYENVNDPIAVGIGPSIFTLSVQYYDPQGAAIPEERGGLLERKLRVYKVEWKNRGDGASFDAVNEIPRAGIPGLYYENDLLDTMWNVLQPARKILAYFAVTAPNDPDTGQPITSFTQVRVGIVQTVGQFSGGSINYHHFEDGTPADFFIYATESPPWWDGSAEAGTDPFVSREAVQDGPASVPGGVWENPWAIGQRRPLIVEDSPVQSLDPRIPTWDPQSVYLWGLFDPVTSYRLRDGASTRTVFEDVLAG
jgi:hypothetical protein